MEAGCSRDVLALGVGRCLFKLQAEQGDNGVCGGRVTPHFPWTLSIGQALLEQQESLLVDDSWSSWRGGAWLLRRRMSSSRLARQTSLIQRHCGSPSSTPAHPSSAPLPCAKKGWHHLTECKRTRYHRRCCCRRPAQCHAALRGHQPLSRSACGTSSANSIPSRDHGFPHFL